MSPAALAECLRRFIAQVVHFSCCVVGAVRNFFFFLQMQMETCINCGEEKSSFNIIQYRGRLGPISSSALVLFSIMMLESSPHLALDPGRERLAYTLHGSWAVHMGVLSPSGDRP